MTMHHDSPSASRTHVLVLLKAMDVLQLLSEGDEFRLRDVATTLGLSKATCHRILGTLVFGGLVEQTSRGHYRAAAHAGRGVETLHTDDHMLRSTSRDAMAELRSATDENVFLFSHRDGRAHCLEVLDGRFASDITVRAGGTLPMHLGAAPRVMLAGLSDREIWDYQSARELLDTSSELSVATVYADVARTRRTGVVISCGEVDYKGMSIGAPIVDTSGCTIGAISVGTLTAATSPERVAELVPWVVRAAEQASAAVEPPAA
jgi:DNA-binding IclR family transcriptional regulator